MKKSILNLGKVLDKTAQEKIKGGIGICSFIPLCPNISDRYCIVIRNQQCIVIGG
ncbi:MULTISPECIES: hypothetical protein [unclassified Tenacibaculum]|uniref:hypothetical protein n=1 Tax=unclassified Tenacibaculum TaxID=2635139 RepID=UPI0013146573|nr:MULTISPECIES: hypothetical protein [unclassified Tenacibaculum]